MPIPEDLAELNALFKRLGARDPGRWASSQHSEGIEQLHRYLFLRQAWALVLSEEDKEWANKEIEVARERPTGPHAGVGRALARCLEKGVEVQDLTDVVRGMQAQLLFALCYLLGDSNIAEPDLRDLGWCLVVADGDYQPTNRVIGALHESVLETDPTGREMQPRDS